MAVLAQEAESTAAVRKLAGELLPDTPALARGMAEHLYAAIPELNDFEDDDLRAELLGSTEANVGQVLRLLASGATTDDVVIPHEALEFLRGNVRRGIPLAALLRSYRLGHAWLWEHWSRALQDRVEDSGELAAGQDQSSAFMFAYVDRVSDAMVEEFGTERERLVRSASQLRAETVRAILGGEPVDEEVASRRLGYELRRHHLALRLSERRERGARARAGGPRGGCHARRRRAARGALRRPRASTSGTGRSTPWLPKCSSATSLRRASSSPAAGPPSASPGSAPRMPRRSQAARVASLMDARAPGVTSYARVELVSLLADDLPRARAFVASELGPLAAHDEPVARLRETALAFMRAGGSPTRVAKELYVHHNTVAYRVKRVEELLGRRLSERPVELLCALTLAGTLGSAVLADDE